MSRCTCLRVDPAPKPGNSTMDVWGLTRWPISLPDPQCAEHRAEPQPPVLDR